MRSGITRQALRRHRWSLLGPACTQFVAAAVISMMITTRTSLDDTRLSPADHRAIAAADLKDVTTVFTGVSIYMSILLVGVTMSLTISQQMRDIALLRTIGASPGQLRRSIALQAGLVAVPSSIAGFVAAIPAAYVWVALLKAYGGVPHTVHVTPQPAALPIVAGIELATSVVGASIAAARVTRIAPTAALTEVSSGRRTSRARTVLGLVLLLAGIVLSGILSSVAPTQAGDAAIFVMLAECIGVGLVGPVILHAVARLLRTVLASGLPRLAVDDIATMSRALSGALIPLVLAAAFATVKVATHTTSAHVTGTPDPAADRWTDYSGTTVYCMFAAVTALNTLITVIVGRRRDLAVLQLAGGSRWDVVRTVAVQTAIVAATALVLSAGVALATLLPILHAGVHTWLPYLPVPAVVAGACLLGLLVAAGMTVPAAVLTRRPPVEVVRNLG